VRAQPLDSKSSFFAVCLYFGINGLGMGAYAGSLPTLQERFGLAPWQLSSLFIVTGVGAILAMQVDGRLADKFGARRVSLAALIPLIVGVALVPLAPSYLWLLGAVFVFGVGNGGIDVTMNVLAVHVEKARPRPVMSFFHGMWAFGNMLGAGAIAAVASLFALDGVATMHVVLLGVCAIAIGVLAAAWALIPETEAVAQVGETGEKAKLPKVAYLLGLMAIAFGFGEGTGMDWSAIHVTEVAKVDPTVGALGVTVLAGFITLIRITADRLVMRIGRRAVVRYGGMVACAGYLIVAVATPLPLLLAGWALVGLGMGVVAPQVYGAAGHIAGGRGLAVVVTFGYVTFLASPAVMGGLVTALGVQRTMFFPAVLLVALVALSRVLPRKEDDPSVISGGGID
jgi:MFS family permease